MKARYCPCLGVKRDRESFDIGFVCALGIGGMTMNVRYRVELNQEERDQLHKMLSGGRHTVRKLKRAQILLVPLHSDFDSWDAGGAEHPVVCQRGAIDSRNCRSTGQNLCAEVL